MSTRLLDNPGARHTITDDLESHFFVLMWTALHWVKHNRPGRSFIDMKYIFDQQRSDVDGMVKGGAGKTQMYGRRGGGLCGVEFSCKPFDDLFWGLWKLFGKYLLDRQRAAQEDEPGEPYKLEL